MLFLLASSRHCCKCVCSGQIINCPGYKVLSEQHLDVYTAGNRPARAHHNLSAMHTTQVHEKSILLPLLPLTALAASEPALVLWTPLVACFSMFPLLVRDGATAAYVGTMLLYLAAMWPACARLIGGAGVAGCSKMQHPPRKLALGSGGQMMGNDGMVRSVGRVMQQWAVRWHSILGILGLLLAAGMHVAREVVPAPERLPWLHDRACITVCFVYLALMGLYLQLRQWSTAADNGVVAGKQKHKTG